MERGEQRVQGAQEEERDEEGEGTKVCFKKQEWKGGEEEEPGPQCRGCNPGLPG